jgi:hypothetical protein
MTMNHDPGPQVERLFWTTDLIDWDDVSDVEPFRTDDGFVFTRRVSYRTPNSWGDGRGATVTIGNEHDAIGIVSVCTRHDWREVESGAFDWAKIDPEARERVAAWFEAKRYA